MKNLLRPLRVFIGIMGSQLLSGIVLGENESLSPDRLPYFGISDSLEAYVDGSAAVSMAPTIHMPDRVMNGVAPAITTQPSSQIVAPGAAVTFSVVATGTPDPVYQWTKNGRFIRGANSATLTISSAAVGDAGSYRVDIYNGAGFARSMPATLSVVPSGLLSVDLASQSIATGQTASFSVAPGAGAAALSYQWYFDGLAISGATSASYTLANAGTWATGFYSVKISDSTGVVAREVATLSVVTNARLSNLSARGMVGSNNEILIVGFVTAGSGNKSILLRGVGPTLGTVFNVSGVLATPTLTLYSHQDVVASNSGWGGTAALTAAFTQVGAFALPPSSVDAALLESLSPGVYTAHVTGANSSSGVALAELYDADTGTPASNLVNISARAYVANGDNVLIAGFVVAGPSSETVLIRGIGPGLRGMGIGNALRNTQVTLFDSTGTQVTANAGWGNDPWIAGCGTQVGAFALARDSDDSALMVTIPPGAYTAKVTSTDGSTGVGLVEIYEVR